MILIIDYGMGNLGSVKRAFEECGADEVVISHYESDFDRCTHAVLPGVGSFADAMNNLEQAGLVKTIRKIALEDRIPFLGICLGMQLLASVGEEHGITKGLGLIPGKVKLLESKTEERVPHVGWNEIEKQQEHLLLEGIKNKTDFYFVHSYQFEPEVNSDVVSTTPYCGGFMSITGRDNIMGTQFHPEKSSSAGFKLIQNFLNYGA
jgi:imidazole glycerol-phosphate synthase subunit HisH